MGKAAQRYRYMPSGRQPQSNFAHFLVINQAIFRFSKRGLPYFSKNLGFIFLCRKFFKKIEAYLMELMGEI